MHLEYCRAAFLGIVVTALAVPPAARAEDPAGLTAAEAMDAVMWGEDPIVGGFALVDHTGRPRTEADFRGKVVMVYFGFTWCPDICPTDLMAIAAALDELGEEAAAEVQPLFITLDPARDTEGLAAYVEAFHPRILGLTGEDAAIRNAANAYKVYYRKVALPGADDYTIDHTAFTYLYDQTGAYLGFLPPGTPAGLVTGVLRPLLAD